MRKIFVAAFAFAGLVITPAIASARPPAATYQAVGARNMQLNRTAAIKQRVELTLTRATNDLNRGQRHRLVTAREARALRAQIRSIRAELRQSLRFDGAIGPREAARLEASLNTLQVSVAQALQPSRRFAANRTGGRR